MRKFHADSVCRTCARVNPYNMHKCSYTAHIGDTFTYAKSGRIGLSKDGKSCKYFIDAKKEEQK